MVSISCALLRSPWQVQLFRPIIACIRLLFHKMVYKVPAFTVGTYVFTSDNVKIPDGVEFCNPLYMSDIDFAEWEIAE